MPVAPRFVRADVDILLPEEGCQQSKLTVFRLRYNAVLFAVAERSYDGQPHPSTNRRLATPIALLKMRVACIAQGRG